MLQVKREQGRVCNMRADAIDVQGPSWYICLFEFAEL